MYIGNDLQIAHPSYKIIDDISSGFNGSTTSFALQVSGATPVPFPISTQQVMISVNGVVQEPDPTGSAGFKLLGSNIVFSSAPANGHAFFGVINAGADYVTAGSEFPDGSATAPSFTFQDDQDTGWFRNASGDVGYSSNGAAILNFDGNGLTIAAGKGLTVDTSTLKVDATNNRVGIGLTAPQVPLHLDGANTRIQFTAPDTGSAAGDGVILGLNGDEDFFINNRESSKNLLFFTVNAERMRINSSGHVGIGTTSPGHPLEVVGDIEISGSNGRKLTFAGDGTSQYFKMDTTLNGPIINGYGGLAFEIGAAGSEKARFDSSGRLLVGGTADSTGALIQAQSTGGSGSVSASRFTNTADGPARFYLFKSRGTSIGAQTIVQDDDDIGEIVFNASDGTNAAQAALIRTEVDGTPGNNDMPGRLSFHTTADGAHTPTERMRIDCRGFVGIGTTSPDYDMEIVGANPVLTIRDTETSQNSANARLRLAETGTSDVLDNYWDVAIDGQEFKIIEGNKVTSAADTRLTLATDGAATFASTVSDSKGNLRSIPQNYQTSAYTLVAGDSGKCITNTAGGVTVPNGVFSAGDAVSIINHSGSDKPITQGSSFTLYNTADASTGNRTLASRGMATIYFTGSNDGYISGAGLS